MLLPLLAMSLQETFLADVWRARSSSMAPLTSSSTMLVRPQTCVWPSSLCKELLSFAWANLCDACHVTSRCSH